MRQILNHYLRLKTKTNKSLNFWQKKCPADFVEQVRNNSKRWADLKDEIESKQSKILNVELASLSETENSLTLYWKA